MNIHFLETFCAVVDCGSFSGAAHRLALSQPAVTQHIKAVERAFGGPLLDRSALPPALTPLGIRVMPHIRQCLLSYQLAVHDSTADPYREQNRLRLAAGFSSGDYIVPLLVSDFRRAYPDISLSVHVNHNREVFRLVLAQACDAAVTVVPQLHPEYQRLSLLPLLEEEFVLAVPPVHPWAREPEVSPGQMRQLPLILRERGSPTRLLIDQSLQAIGGLHPAQEVMEMASQEAIKQAILAGLGVGFVSDLSVMREQATGRLATVRIRGLRITRPLHIVYVKPSPMPPALQAFLAFVRSLKRKGWPRTRRV